MNLLEISISTLIASSLMISMSQSCLQIYQALNQQQTNSLLQTQALQAFQMMGQAIQQAQLNKSMRGFKLMAKDSASMSNSKVGEFQIRKGASSMDGSDAFYTQQISEENPYQSFFVQQQGHYQQREGVLYLQTKNKKGQLQNEALIGHVQSMQIQVGTIHQNKLEWHQPYEASERASKKQAHWKQIRAIKIELKLKRGAHGLELERIYALRQT
jgi:hypothetical protein